MAKQSFTTGQVLTAAQMTSLQQTAMLGGAASAKTASYTLVAADAGTAISMSSASATTITVNTALFAAGDTVQITNLGAGVCTITAGTATVNSSASLALAQYESGTLTFTSASAAIFIKGAGPAATSGGMTLLSTTTLSGASTTISGIDQTYKDLFVIVTGVTNGTPDGYRYIRPNNTSSIAIQAVAYGGNSVNQETDIYIPRDGDTTFNNSDNAASVIIYNYASSTTNKPFNGSISYAKTGVGHQGQVFGGSIKTNTAISSLVFVQTGGGSFNAGTVKIYGVN